MQFSIVRIASTARQANLMEPWRKSGEDQHFVGSGFIIHNSATEGPLIATNAHVISDAHTVCIVLTAKDKTC
jgi:S1-C subfamily serine protease